MCTENWIHDMRITVHYYSSIHVIKCIKIILVSNADELILTFVIIILQLFL